MAPVTAPGFSRTRTSGKACLVCAPDKPKFIMSAPHAPPIELRSAYTMGERYPLSEYYVDESSHDSHYVFSNADIIELLEEAHKSISSASRGVVLAVQGNC